MSVILKRLSLFFDRQSRGRVVLSALAVFLLFTLFILPDQARQAGAISKGAGSPDTLFYYTPTQLYDMAAAYRTQGRIEYVRARFTFDLVWPLVYFAFLASGLSYFYSRTFPRRSPWRLANLVALFGLGFDYLENISTSVVMLRFPEPTPVIDALAGVFTLLKWVWIGAGFALLAAGFFFWMSHKHRKEVIF